MPRWSVSDGDHAVVRAVVEHDADDPGAAVAKEPGENTCRAAAEKQRPEHWSDISFVRLIRAVGDHRQPARARHHELLHHAGARSGSRFYRGLPHPLFRVLADNDLLAAHPEACLEHKQLTVGHAELDEIYVLASPRRPPLGENPGPWQVLTDQCPFGRAHPRPAL